MSDARAPWEKDRPHVFGREIYRGTRTSHVTWFENGSCRSKNVYTSSSTQMVGHKRRLQLKDMDYTEFFPILFKFYYRSTSYFGVSQVFTILLMIKSFNLPGCTILSWLNCYHLFVWSVFSPKLLYEGVVSLVFGVFVLTVSTVSKI
jgi:hypothetical protein